MRRINDDEVALSNEELSNLYDFIRDALYRDWDAYTDRFILNKSREDGMRQMNPSMYDFADQLVVI